MRNLKKEINELKNYNKNLQNIINETEKEVCKLKEENYNLKVKLEGSENYDNFKKLIGKVILFRENTDNYIVVKQGIINKLSSNGYVNISPSFDTIKSPDGDKINLYSSWWFCCNKITVLDILE